jgi:hydroxymethylbilane synthase
MVAKLEHRQTRTIIMGERAFLNRLEGGCQVPIAAHGKIDNALFTICGLVATVDGKTLIKETFSGPEGSAETIGVELADHLVSLGAKTIMEHLKSDLDLNHER